MMYEPTDICPYTERCGSFQSIIRIERELQNAWWRTAWERPPGAPEGDGEDDHGLDILQKRLENLALVRRRCLQFHNRCLKFWQFRAQDAGEMKVAARLISQTETHE